MQLCNIILPALANIFYRCQKLTQPIGKYLHFSVLIYAEIKRQRYEKSL